MRKSERAVAQPQRLDSGVAFSFKFGEVAGWLGCRFCGKWHRSSEGEFTFAQRRQPIETRHCTRWADTSRRNQALSSGAAPLQPSAGACTAHLKNMTRKRRTLVQMHGSEAEAHYEPSAESDEEQTVIDEDACELLALKRELRRIDKYTNRNHLHRRSRLWVKETEWQWAKDVSAAATVDELHALVTEYADAITPTGAEYVTRCGSTTYSTLQERLVADASLATIRAFVTDMARAMRVDNAHRSSGPSMDSALMQAEMEERLERERDAFSSGWDAQVHTAQCLRADCTDLLGKAPEELSREERQRLRTGRGGAIILTTTRQTSAAEVEQLRATGKAQVSATTPPERVDGYVPWRTDAHML